MAQAKYITATELAESFDSRMIKQLSSYTGSPQSSVDNSVVTNAIEKASAEVESYALRGGLYTTTHLSSLQSSDDWSLKTLVSTLTMKHLFRGKTGQIPPDMIAMVAEATATLEELREGKRVFNLDVAHNAGKAKAFVVSASVRGNLNMPSDSKYFPTRITQKY
ncbi:MAG: hypothetical protein Unbinned97contig1000_3 [Prokaryotic dsDNA virus sp.]|nr:MAG: hypothetical protein Unbinned97contig1000_3 [Prokaryotic dsDNA virus sp.]|tara:strand:+ start:883 stop:1374 length:492 start_codon:yes stop_codon:yes gene_type:complete